MIFETYKLSRDDEQRLVALAQSGDQRARQRVVEFCMPLLKHLCVKVARRYRGMEWTELIGSASIILLGCLRDYRPGSGARLGQYAAVRIVGDLKREIGREQSSLNLSRYGAIKTREAGVVCIRIGGQSDDDEGGNLAASLRAPSVEPNECELGELARGLPERLGEVVEGCLRGMSQKQIAERLGISPSRVCQLRSIAVDVLRDRAALLGAAARNAQPVRLGRARKRRWNAEDRRLVGERMRAWWARRRELAAS